MSNKPFRNTIHISIFSLVAAVCLFSPASSSAKDAEEGAKLEWSSIPDANGYLVEIKDTNGRITRQKTNATQIFVDLKPGTYEHRIGVLNRYGRVSIFSTWIPFEVILSRPPVLTSSARNAYLAKDFPEVLEIKGRYLNEATKITLKNSNGEELPIKSVEFREPDSLIVSLDKKKIPEGSVSLRLENPRNKVTETEAFLVVAETPERLAALQRQYLPQEPSSKEPFRFDYGALARSAVLPGWGQLYQGKSKVRSFAFPILVATAGAFTYLKGQEYIHAVKDYDAARRTNLMLGSAITQTGNIAIYPLAAINYFQIPSKLGVASSAYHQVEISIGILAALYLANLADAAFFPGTRQVKIEGTDKTATWSPLLRNERDSNGFTYASTNQQYLRQRVEVGVQFSW